MQEMQEVPGSIPGSGRCPREGNGNPLQCSWLENPIDRGAWRATVYRVGKSRTELSTCLLLVLFLDNTLHSMCVCVCVCVCGESICSMSVFPPESRYDEIRNGANLLAHLTTLSPSCLINIYIRLKKWMGIPKADIQGQVVILASLKDILQ